jgi:hypothetical protein
MGPSCRMCSISCSWRAVICAIGRCSSARPSLPGCGGSPEPLRHFEHFADEGSRVFESACGLKAEGLISKRRGALYRLPPLASWG